MKICSYKLLLFITFLFVGLWDGSLKEVLFCLMPEGGVERKSSTKRLSLYFIEKLIDGRSYFFSIFLPVISVHIC